MPRRAPGGASAPLPPIDFGALAAALLQRAEQLVSAWLAGGKRQGHEWVCGSLAGGAGASCSVNVHTGRWSDFATGETVMRPMFELNEEQGTTPVLVTHDQAIAARCQRRITIEAGQMSTPVPAG